MKYSVLLFILIITLTTNIKSQVSEENLSTVTVYSHDNVEWAWGGVTRWGNRYPVVGVTVACPYWFRERWVYIEGFGNRWC